MDVLPVLFVQLPMSPLQPRTLPEPKDPACKSHKANALIRGETFKVDESAPPEACNISVFDESIHDLLPVRRVGLRRRRSHCSGVLAELNAHKNKRRQNCDAADEASNG